MSATLPIPTLPFYPARPKQGGRNFEQVHAALYAGKGWLFEPKFNGWRAILHAPSGTLWSRHGEQLSIAGEFTQAIDRVRIARENAMRAVWDTDNMVLVQGEADWYDVEALDRRHNRGRRSLIVLDMPLLGLPYDQRSGVFRTMFEQVGTPNDHAAEEDMVFSSPCFTDGPALWQQVQEINRHYGCIFYEGLVAKRAASSYPLQLRSPSEETPDWIKHRFTTK
jgi:ATP-dependent DNA ligase